MGCEAFDTFRRRHDDAPTALCLIGCLSLHPPQAPFAHPARVATREIPACVLLEYRAMPGEAVAVAEHFAGAQRALREQLGLEICLGLGDLLHWPLYATAMCCARAFGGGEAAARARAESRLSLWPQVCAALVVVTDPYAAFWRLARQLSPQPIADVICGSFLLCALRLPQMDLAKSAETFLPLVDDCARQRRAAGAAPTPSLVGVVG